MTRKGKAYRAGAVLDAVGVVCSDGSTLGPFGGTGGSSSTTATCQNGFSSVRVEYVTDYGWNSIGGIVADCSGSRSSLDGYNSGVVTEFACPAGQVLQAVRGSEGVGTGTYSHCSCRVVYSLQVTCKAKSYESGEFVSLDKTSVLGRAIGLNKGCSDCSVMQYIC